MFEAVVTVNSRTGVKRVRNPEISSTYNPNHVDDIYLLEHYRECERRLIAATKEQKRLALIGLKYERGLLGDPGSQPETSVKEQEKVVISTRTTGKVRIEELPTDESEEVVFPKKSRSSL